MKPVKVILNPQAGRGRSGNATAEVKAAMQKAGLTCDIETTTGPGHAIELARSATQAGYSVVAAAGGDGTVNEVVNGLALAAPAGGTLGRLGLLPLGSGNDFADMVGCPSDLEQAAKVIADGQLRQIDVGCAVLGDGTAAGGTMTRLFDNNMGIGFEARVTLESYRIRRLQGTLLYVAAALRAASRMAPIQMELACQTEANGLWKRSGRTLMVTIGNSRRTGGGFYLTPDALMDDGLLDMGVIGPLPLWHLLTLLPLALVGKHTLDPAVTLLRCSRLTIQCDEGVPVQLDGEVVTESARRIEVTVQPQRLQVLARPGTQ